MKNKQDDFPFRFSNDVHYLYVVPTYLDAYSYCVVAHDDEECVAFLRKAEADIPLDSRDIKGYMAYIKDCHKFILANEDCHKLGVLETFIDNK